MVSLKLRAILFPFQMEPRREMLLQELGVRKANAVTSAMANAIGS
jgi:hypothetical protein